LFKAVKWRDGKGDIVKILWNHAANTVFSPEFTSVSAGIRFTGCMILGEWRQQFAENRQQHYNRMCEGMVEELMSRYGDLAIVWFDGGAHGPEKGGPDVLSVFEKHQSNCIFYHNTQRADIRWGGSESGTVPYPSWGTFPVSLFTFSESGSNF
jgi:hypothetical protein